MTAPHPQEPDRLHGFDAVRGLAAVAVVALHASYAYALFPLPGLVWPVPLDEPSRLVDAAFWWIEGSVMPLFFTLSGYFLARSLSRQSPGQVAAGRTRRLLLPMATVGLAVLVIDLHVWVLGLIATGRASVSDYRRLKFAPQIQADLFGPAHLWYVEYLWLLCAAVCGVAWLGNVARSTLTELPSPWGEGLGVRGVGGRPLSFASAGYGAGDAAKSEAAARHPLTPDPSPQGEGNRARSDATRRLAACGLAALFASAATLLSFHPQIVLGFQHGWLPDPPKLAHAAIFLLLGILLHQTRGLVEATRRFAPIFLVTAFGAFASLLPRIHDALRSGRAADFDPILGGLLAAFAVSATFGHIGAGLRWLDRPSPTLARLATASFWIYLVHHPLIGLFQIALRPVPLPAVVKFCAVFGMTLLVCLVSYRLLVKNGVVGRLLDGERPWRAFRRGELLVSPLPRQSEARKAA